jgi:hypothetical protein
MDLDLLRVGLDWRTLGNLEGLGVEAKHERYERRDVEDIGIIRKKNMDRNEMGARNVGHGHRCRRP